MPPSRSKTADNPELSSHLAALARIADEYKSTTQSLDQLRNERSRAALAAHDVGISWREIAESIGLGSPQEILSDKDAEVSDSSASTNEKRTSGWSFW